MVWRTIRQLARQQKQAQPAGPGGSTLWPRQHQRQISIGVRAKPFVAFEQPVAAHGGGPRDGGGGADIGASRLLGHEHRALQVNVHVGGGEAGQIARTQFRAAKFGQGAGEGIGHAYRTAQAKFCLHKEV